METKPNYVIVGAFIITLSAILIIISLWLFGYKTGEKYKTYLILTQYSVAGLSNNAAVKYKGVDVGQVEKIDIDPSNPELVRIFINVKRSIPIKTNTVATISAQGLTGLAYINLTGGTKNAPLLSTIDKNTYPVIKSQMSEFQKISTSLPHILENANRLIQDLSKTFNESNQQKIANILSNTLNTSKTLNMDLQNVNSTLNDANEAIAAVKNAALTANSTLINANELILNLQKSADNLHTASLELKELIKENKPKIDAFTHEDFANFNRLLNEIQKTSKQANSLIEELKSNPSYIIYGKPKTPAPTEGGNQ